MKKTFMTIAISAAMMMPFSACQEAQRENPLLVESQQPLAVTQPQDWLSSTWPNLLSR